MPLALRLLSLLLLTFGAYAQTQPMPHAEGESFAGQKVVLPDAARGHVAVLVFGFTKASKEPTRAWAQRTLREFGTQSGFEVYQLPVLEDVPRLVRGMVISSIKKGVPENLRDHFVPILHGESELKQLVGYKEPDDAYVVVLDPSGQIAGQMHGPFTEAAFAHLRDELTLAIKIPSRN
jgi:hypothetical protein